MVRFTALIAILFGVVAITIAKPANVNISAKTVGILAQNRNLRLVGQFGSKVYWEDTQMMYYTSAKAFCENLNFALVQIDSEEELDYLFGTNVGPFEYWTSGIDIATPAQYKWDLGWEDHPVSVRLDDATPFSAIYWHRMKNKLMVDSLWNSKRPLCQSFEV